MAGYAGSVGLTGYIAPADTLDTYALQSEVFNRGGFRSVADITERDAITADRRKLGMLVYCFSDAAYYTLLAGLNNTDWVVANIGGSGKFIDLTDTPTNYNPPISLGFPMLYAMDGDKIGYGAYLNLGVGYISPQTLPVELDEEYGFVNLEANTKSSGDGVADYYLPYINWYNNKLQGRFLFLKHRYDNPVGTYEDVRVLPHPDAGGSGDDDDSLYDSKGVSITEVVIKAGDTAVFVSQEDDPQDWYFLGMLNSGANSESEKHFEDIPSDSSIVEEGYYFVYGSNTELTINDDLSNRVFHIKSIGTTIFKTESGVIDGAFQDINMNAGDAITIIAKDDDTYLILNKF